MKYNNDSNNDFPIIHTDRTIQANKLDITIKDHKEKHANSLILHLQWI